MECLSEAQRHAKAIRYYFAYAGAGGYARALGHFNVLSSLYASILDSGLPPSESIKQICESAQSMIEQMKEREETHVTTIQNQWMYL